MRFTLATLIWCALLVAPATAAEDCGVARPSETGAWRGELVARTAISAQPGGKTRAWLSPARVGAVLVLGAASDRGGRCWLLVRLPTRPNVAKAWVAADRVVLSE